MNLVRRERSLKLFQASLLLCLALMASSAGVSPARAQGVPVVIYGYVHMPDGSPAAGASVLATCDSDSGSATTNPQGYYQITLSIEGSQTVRVTARKGDLSAVRYIKVGEGTGKVQVNLTLRSQSGGGGGGGWAGGGRVSHVKILEATVGETALGEPVEVRLRVLNEGDRPAENVQVLIYLEDWTLLDTVELAITIPAGSERTLGVRFDSSPLGEGTRHLILVLVTSQGSAKAEVDVSVVSRAMLDLYVVAPQEASPGQEVWVNGTVRNAGGVPARGVTVRVMLGGRAAGSAYLGDIPPGLGRQFSLRIRVPEDVAGALQLEVLVTGRRGLEVREVRTLTAASAAAESGGANACAAIDLSRGWEALTLAKSSVELASNLTGAGEGLDDLSRLESLLGRADQAARSGNCTGAQELLESVVKGANELAELAMSRSAQWIVNEANRLGSLGDPSATALSEAIWALLRAYEEANSPAEKVNLLRSASRLIAAANAALSHPPEEASSQPPPRSARQEVGGPSYTLTLAVAAASAALGTALGAMISRRR